MNLRHYPYGSIMSIRYYDKASCLHCQQPFDEHYDDTITAKCLYQPTEFAITPCLECQKPLVPAHHGGGTYCHGCGGRAP